MLNFVCWFSILQFCLISFLGGWGSLWHFLYIKSSYVQTTKTSFFPNWMLLSFLPCFITLARNSSSALKCRNCRHLCSVPDVRECFQFSSYLIWCYPWAYFTRTELYSCIFTVCILQCPYRNQRTNWKSQFSPSTIWFLWLKPRLSAYLQLPSPILSHLSSPDQDF